MKPVRAAARAMLGAVFIASGARSFANPDRHVLRAKLVTDRLGPALEKVDPRLPTDARALVKLNGATQLVAGLLLATGHLRRPAAAVLAGTLIPTTVAGHPFWAFDSAAERREQRLHFGKNLGLLGGLLLAVADTEGRPGLGWRTSHAVDRTQRTVRRAARTARREAKIAVVAAGAARRLPG
jgi:uncharacterized membrane protein YphA (DoxX/SURF4 family)